MNSAQCLTFTETATAPAPARVRLARRSRANTIELNDALRRNIFSTAALGEVILTAGVVALSDEARFALVDEVRCFEDFTPDNDPYDEHDFGRIDFRGARYFWKIDYYDLDLKFHSPDKSNPELTRRVLTIMRAGEY